MTYEVFGRELTEAVEEAGLTRGLMQVEDTLASGDLARTQTIGLNPDTTGATKPFDTTVRLSWTWSSIDTARTTRNEEDVLTDLFGRSSGSRRTIPIMIRLDVRICAHMRYNLEVPLPGELERARWAAEAMIKMEACFPVKTAKISGYPDPVVLSWLETPRLLAGCGPAGNLLVKDLWIEAGQLIAVPRKWDDQRRRPDPNPRRALLDLCKRIATARDFWAKAARHILPKPRRVERLH